MTRMIIRPSREIYPTHKLGTFTTKQDLNNSSLKTKLISPIQLPNTLKFIEKIQPSNLKIVAWSFPISIEPGQRTVNRHILLHHQMEEKPINNCKSVSFICMLIVVLDFKVFHMILRN